MQYFLIVFEHAEEEKNYILIEIYIGNIFRYANFTIISNSAEKEIRLFIWNNFILLVYPTSFDLKPVHIDTYVSVK